MLDRSEAGGDQGNVRVGSFGGGGANLLVGAAGAGVAFARALRFGAGTVFCGHISTFVCAGGCLLHLPGSGATSFGAAFSGALMSASSLPWTDEARESTRSSILAALFVAAFQ